MVDGTLGDGGHAEAILEGTAPDGTLVGLDRDPDALRVAGARLARFGTRVSLAHASFRELARVLGELGAPRIDGVLLDLGVSSRQLDEPARGFRFGTETARATALDMRMDPTQGESAAELLARASESELADCFRRYGELPGAGRLARAIVAQRGAAPLRSVADLLDVIRAARIGGGRKHNPATLAFQALRIAVNDELGALEEGLGAAIDALAPGGRLCVIAYHSLEDRIAKQRIAREERACVCAPSAPVCTCGRKPRLVRLTRKPVRPSDAEVSANPRARSARLRAAEKLPEAA
jgi:16S rRNA (cytosine1402-N4)-methyltransferase